MSATVLDRLRNPMYSLPMCGHIIDQQQGRLAKYDPTKITHRLQSTILNYVANTPRTESGQTKWLTIVKYRQAGASLTSELALYPIAAFSPGHDHVCMADKRERAEYLHKRVQVCHDNWPERYRAPTISAKETRQLTFAGKTGGKMRVLTARGNAEGIGQSFDSFHGSEIPFWSGASEVMSQVIPAMINRDDVKVIMESTPAPQSNESSDYFKDLYFDGKFHRGRWVSAFFPFWDGKLNARKWDKNSSLTHEEVDLLNKYGRYGLTKENLAFRRLVLDTDQEIRRNPELFKVWYPFDDTTCWMVMGGSAIPAHVLERHLTDLVEWDEEIGYKEYLEPKPGAVYVIGADPAGFGARDHASFQVFEVWEDQWEQAAVFGKVTDPVTFAAFLLKIARRYNNALIVPESNGVGAATISLLIEAGYQNLYYRDKNKPGALASQQNNEKYLGFLIDALMDNMIIHDQDTVAQLTTYKNDKAVERSATSEILTGDATGRYRRSRHHWDKISALIYMVVGAREAPIRRRRLEEPTTAQVIEFSNMSYNQQANYRKLCTALEAHRKAEMRSSTQYKKTPRFKRFKK